MARGHFYKPITDAEGNLVPNVTVEVRRETAGLPLAAMQNRAGDNLGSTIMFASGIIDLYAPEGLGGFFRLHVYATGYDETFYDQPIGSAAGVDADAVLVGSFNMAFETETTAPPSAGSIRANNANLSAGDILWISAVNVAGSSIDARLAELGEGDTILITVSDGTQASVLVDSATDEGDYYEVTYSAHDGETAIPAGAVAMQISHKGDASTVPGPQGESGKRFDLSVYAEGRPTAGERIARHVFSDTPLTFPAGLTTSRASSETAADAEAVFSVTINDVEVATITFAAASDEGTFAAPDPIAVEAGDVLEVYAPNPQDADLADVSITIAGGVGDAESFTAAEIAFVPAGGLEAEDVQAALEELDSEKIAKALLTTAGDIIVRGASAPERKALGADDTFLGAAGGVLAYRTPAQVRASIGLATGDSPQFAGIELGHASDTTLSRIAAGVLGVEGNALYPNVPLNDKSSAYTFVLADAGQGFRHPTSDNNPRTWTIPANASVAFPVGTVIVGLNEINTLTVAITSDTLVLVGSGSTGSRTVAAHSMFTLWKVASTRWYIQGAGVT
jgi:hypothetical protein